MKYYSLIILLILVILLVASCGTQNKAEDIYITTESKDKTIILEETTDETSIESTDINSEIIGTWDGDTATDNGSIEEYVFSEDGTILLTLKNGNNSSKTARGTYRIDIESNIIYVTLNPGEINPVSPTLISSGEAVMFNIEETDNGISLITISNNTELTKVE